MISIELELNPGPLKAANCPVVQSHSGQIYYNESKANNSIWLIQHNLFDNFHLKSKIWITLQQNGL